MPITSTIIIITGLSRQSRHRGRERGPLCIGIEEFVRKGAASEQLDKCERVCRCLGGEIFSQAAGYKLGNGHDRANFRTELEPPNKRADMDIGAFIAAQVGIIAALQ